MPYPYTWATNPGTRVAPSAGEQASGFIDGTPSTPLVLNAVLGEIVDILDPLDTAFAVQHNPTTGVHTGVTAVTVSASTSQSSPLFSFLPLGGIETRKRYLYDQRDPLGPSGGGGTASFALFVIAAQNVATMQINNGQTGIFLIGDVGPGIVVDDALIYFAVTPATAYDIDWDLLVFNDVIGQWENPPGGAVTGNAAGTSDGTGFLRITASFPDQTPIVAGHGVGGFTVQQKLGLRLNNNAAAHVHCYEVSVDRWIASINAALGAL